LIASVPRMTGTTPAQALGDVPALFLAGIAIALAGSHRIRSRSKRPVI
jgi:apolipoprotein N-acyltransferase